MAKTKTKAPHKDCPFTREEIDAIEAQLYYVNSTNHCANPMHQIWYGAFERTRQHEAEEEYKAHYKAWLENELKQFTLDF